MLKFTSTPHHVASAIPSDRTFNVSPVAPLANNSRDMATLAAEVSAAVVAASKCQRSSAGCMNPKLPS